MQVINEKYRITPKISSFWFLRDIRAIRENFEKQIELYLEQQQKTGVFEKDSFEIQTKWDDTVHLGEIVSRR